MAVLTLTLIVVALLSLYLARRRKTLIREDLARKADWEKRRQKWQGLCPDCSYFDMLEDELPLGLNDNQIILLTKASLPLIPDEIVLQLKKLADGQMCDLVYLNGLERSLTAEVLDYYLPGHKWQQKTTFECLQPFVRLAEECFEGTMGTVCFVRRCAPSDEVPDGFARFVCCVCGGGDFASLSLLFDFCREFLTYGNLWFREKCDSAADAGFQIEANRLMEEVRERVVRLRQIGVADYVIQKLFDIEPQLSRLLITKGNRIKLLDYGDMEIEMEPLPKAVFFLFLRHPEGIAFKCLPDYADELYDIYAGLSVTDSIRTMRKRVDSVTDPTKNSINEKCSRIREAFIRKFNEPLARNYYITGERAEPKKIILPRNLLIFE